MIIKKIKEKGIIDKTEQLDSLMEFYLKKDIFEY